ncbi:unnamed protein product [Rhodiola kirilowii]
MLHWKNHPRNICLLSIFTPHSSDQTKLGYKRRK